MSIRAPAIGNVNRRSWISRALVVPDVEFGPSRYYIDILLASKWDGVIHLPEVRVSKSTEMNHLPDVFLYTLGGKLGLPNSAG